VDAGADRRRYCLGRADNQSGESKAAANNLTSALDVQKLSTDQLIAAIHAKADAEGKSIKSSYAAEVQAYNVARATRTRAIEELKLAKAILERADAEAGKQGDSQGGIDFGIAAGARYERQIKELTKSLAEANREIRDTHIPLIKREMTAAYRWRRRRDIALRQGGNGADCPLPCRQDRRRRL
jgi:hypothetical protein